MASGDADDLKQLVAIKLLSLTEERLNAIENIDAYVATVVRNEANRLFSKTSRPEFHLEEVEHSDHLESQKRMEFSIILKEVWRLLDLEDRRLFELMLFDYDDKEIAVALNISYDAARKRVSRLRQKLEGLIQQHVEPSLP